jgi:hypothetical protein
MDVEKLALIRLEVLRKSIEIAMNDGKTSVSEIKKIFNSLMEIIIPD